MSKRKDIDFIHNVKGISYKEARRLYHDSGDDLFKALGIVDFESIDNIDLKPLVEYLNEVINHIARGAALLADGIVNFVNAIDWEEIAQAANKALEADKTIEISDEYFKEDPDQCEI